MEITPCDVRICVGATNLEFVKDMTGRNSSLQNNIQQEK